MSLIRNLMCLSLVLTGGCLPASSGGDNVSIAALAARQFSAQLTPVKTLRETDEHVATLMAFEADGLRQLALVLRPVSAPPPKGFPVLIFGHGFHPDPPQHGVSAATGEDWRPGDYYRGIPERYARAGYLVIAPDYRGHNASEGMAFTRTGVLATSYYAADVLHLTAALPSLPDADPERVYFSGHSMGGEVGLKVLLAGARIRAASLWAPVAATTREQVLYYALRGDESRSGAGPAKLMEYMGPTNSVYSALPFRMTFDQVDPIEQLERLQVPVVVHHARGDQSVPYMWSESLVARLDELGRPFEFFAYDSTEHLFSGADRERAALRDLAFFARH